MPKFCLILIVCYLFQFPEKKRDCRNIQKLLFVRLIMGVAKRSYRFGGSKGGRRCVAEGLMGIAIG